MDGVEKIKQIVEKNEKWKKDELEQNNCITKKDQIKQDKINWLKAEFTNNFYKKYIFTNFPSAPSIKTKSTIFYKNHFVDNTLFQ